MMGLFMAVMCALGFNIRGNLSSATDEKIVQLREPKFAYYKDFTQDDVTSCFCFLKGEEKAERNLWVQGFDFSSFVGVRGVYPVQIKAEKSAAYLDAKITVYDDIPPVIEGFDEICLYENQNLSQEEMLKSFQSRDNVSGNCSVSIADSRYKNGEKALGLYPIYLSSADADGNEARKRIYVKKIAEDESRYWLKGCSFWTYDLFPIPAKAVFAALIRSGILQEGQFNYAEYAQGNYPFSSSEVQIGLYQETLKAYGLDGKATYIDLSFEVKGEKNDQTSSVPSYVVCLCLLSLLPLAFILRKTAKEK